MSNYRDNISKMSVKQFEKTLPKQGTSKPKKSLLERFLSLPFKFGAAFLGIDKETMSSHSNSSHHNGPSGHYMPTQHSPAAFREQHHFSPENWVIKEMQAEAYHKLVDGKGDHDCGHEHDYD